MVSPLRLRCELSLKNAETGVEVVRGWTVHAVTDAAGKPARPPEVFVEAIRAAGAPPPA